MKPLRPLIRSAYRLSAIPLAVLMWATLVWLAYEFFRHVP
jgi:hypothetical protein